MSYLRFLFFFVHSGVQCLVCIHLVYCAPNVANFSGFSILDCPYGFR